LKNICFEGAYQALSGKFTHGLYSVLSRSGGLYSVYVAVFQRKQHINLSYTITLSPTTYYGVCTPTDMTYTATLTPKHTHKQMRLYAKNVYNMHQHY